MSMETAQPRTTAGERTHVRVWICALILLLSTVAYADRSILSISGSGIKDEFGLTTVQLGFVLSAFSWAYVIGQVPGGLILDRFGTKRVYGVTLVIWSLATFLLGFVGKFASGTARRRRAPVRAPLHPWFHRGTEFPGQRPHRGHVVSQT